MSTSSPTQGSSRSPHKQKKPHRKIELKFGPFKSIVENASLIEIAILIIVLAFLIVIVSRLFK